MDVYRETHPHLPAPAFSVIPSPGRPAFGVRCRPRAVPMQIDPLVGVGLCKRTRLDGLVIQKWSAQEGGPDFSRE